MTVKAFNFLLKFLQLPFVGFVIPPPQQPPLPEVSAGAVWEEQLPKAGFGCGGFGAGPGVAVSLAQRCGAIAWPFAHKGVSPSRARSFGNSGGAFFLPL